GHARKSMYEGALYRRDILLLRESQCCWEAGTTLPSTTESARNPPLAQPAFIFLSKANRCSSPLTCSRLSGAAWETAILVMLFVADGVTAKFSNDRQKLHVALAFGIHWAGTFTPPLMLTSSGLRPSPAT